MSNTINFDLVPTGIKFDHENIQRISNSSTETAAAFSRKIEKLQNTYSEIRANFSRETDEAVADALPENRKQVLKFSKDQEVRKASKSRQNLITGSKAERAAMLKALKGLADEAHAIQAIYKSPAMLLGGIGMDNSKRLHFQNLLAEAGPIELETAAQRAIMASDLILAAAIATVIDRRPRDRRPFTVAALAERVVGQQWLRVNKMLDGVQLAFKSAFAANREFERGKADPVLNLSLTLSKRAIEEAEAKLEDKDEEKHEMSVATG